MVTYQGFLTRMVYLDSIQYAWDTSFWSGTLNIQNSGKNSKNPAPPPPHSPPPPPPSSTPPPSNPLSSSQTLLALIHKDEWNCLFVCWLLNVPAICQCILGMDLLRQFYVLPHWDRSCRSNFPSHLVTVYWHWATSPSADPIMPGAWQGSHWSANFEVTGMTRPWKIP